MALFGKKAENIEIKPNKDYVMREIDISECADNATYTVGTGCRLVKIFNGEAQTPVVDNKPRKVFERGQNAENTKLVAVNTEATSALQWGVGGLHYTDREHDVHTDSFGLHGEMAFSAIQVRSFLSNDTYNVRPEDVKNMIFNDLKAIVVEKFAKFSQRVNYKDLDGIRIKICNEVQQDLQAQMDSLGLSIKVCSFTIDGFMVNDAFVKEYEKRRAEGSFSSGIGIFLPTEPQAKPSDDVTAFLKGCKPTEMTEPTTPALSGAPTAPVEPKAPPKPTTVACTRCNHRNKPSAVYCAKCGLKLK